MSNISISYGTGQHMANLDADNIVKALMVSINVRGERLTH